MKRGPGSGGGGSLNYAEGPMKRPRGDKFETRVLVPSKVAGSIIGKGGSNIQKLRTDNNANVRIPDCPGPERVMTILTNDSESAVKVVEQSLPFMTEDAVRGGPGGAANSSPDAAVELRFLIHQSIVGGIIGRAGFKIKEIRDNSGANIKVYQNCAPQSTDRCVAIQGSADKIAKAAQEVLNVVAMTEIKGPDQQYDPINFDSYYASEYGGYGSDMDPGFGGAPGGMRGGGGGRGRGGFVGQEMGRGFGGIRGGGQVGGHAFGGGRGGFNNGGGGGFGRGRGNMGGFGGRGGGFGGGRGAPFGEFGGGPGFGAGGVPDGAPYGAGFGGGAGDHYGGGGGGGGDLDKQEPHEETAVTIPKDMAGAIIGPGGSRIRKIRADSKASITIAEPEQGSTERIITISGTKRQIQTAQYLLQQSVRENAGMPPAAAGGGGGGGGGGHQGGYVGY